MPIRRDPLSDILPVSQNFISSSTLREVSVLRREFLGPLMSIGFIALGSTPQSASLNINSENQNLIKSVFVGGFWPQVARVHLPKSAIKFDKVQSGTVQRENTAKEYKIYDIREGRVFLHPSSILFGNASWKSSFLVYFQKSLTTKLFLRGATEVGNIAALHRVLPLKDSTGAPLRVALVWRNRVSQPHWGWVDCQDRG